MLTFFSLLTTLFLVGLFARLPSSARVEALMAEAGRLGILDGGGISCLFKLEEEGARTSELDGPVRVFVDVGGFLDIEWGSSA